MPMPRLPEIHHNRTVARSAFQLNMNNAATAPRCRRIRKIVVTQMIGCVKVLSFRKIRIITFGGESDYPTINP